MRDADGNVVRDKDDNVTVKWISHVVEGLR